MKYRKKPIVVEAYQTNVELDIETLEGVMHARVGDYIITGINGEKYPCKPDIFEKTYELVKENNYEKGKELAPLKALKELKKRYGKNFSLNDDERCRVIETALKRLEELEKAFVSLSKEDEKTKKLLSKEIEKNRALEIIKEKKWLVEDILNAFIENKEKYDLLKEVLL